MNWITPKQLKAESRPAKRKTNRPEAEAQKAILAYLHTIGWFVWRTNSGAVKIGDRFVRFNGADGCSDLIGLCVDGRFLSIETKSPTGRLTAKQKAFQERIRTHGGIAFVARSVDDVRLHLREAGYQVP